MSGSRGTKTPGILTVKIVAGCRRRARRVWVGLRSQPRERWIEASLLGAILLYGGLLRFEALYRKYQSVFDGENLARLQAGLATLASWIRPASFAWVTDGAISTGHWPYWGDQRGYIGLARAGGTFYESGIREPMFVLATRVGLVLTSGHEIGLSVMTTTVSALVPLATYALGRTMAGPVAGLSAALLVAIHRDVIDWGTDGWRADLFTLLAVLFAYACIRLYRQPSRRRAGLAGIIGGLACLTRITALSFVAPTILAMAFFCDWPAWWRPSRYTVLAGIVVVALVTPYLVNCWIVYGDPLYSISFATSFYLSAARADDTAEVGVGSYVLARFADDPVRTTDSLLRGLTIYPWGNKWRGLRAHWGPWLANIVSSLAVLGLLAWLWTAEGRLVLLIYITSLVPLVLNWELPGGSAWRFTMHAYPFLVVAATYAGSRAMRASWLIWRKELPLSHWWRQSLRPALATAALVSAVAGLVYVLPLVDMGRSLSLGRPFSVVAGPRDAIFFRSGWYPRERLGNQTVRYVEESPASVWIPMLAGHEYRLVLRLQTVPDQGDRSLAVAVRLNGREIERLELRYDPQRIGAYPMIVPAEPVRTGFNRLEIDVLSSNPLRDSGPGLLLWYVRVEPQ